MRSTVLSAFTASAFALSMLPLAAACADNDKINYDLDGSSGAKDANNGGRATLAEQGDAGTGGARASGGASSRVSAGGTDLEAGAAGNGTGGAADAMAGASGNMVGHGRVVDFDTRRPLPKRRVVIGSTLGSDDARALATDEDGFFPVRPMTSYQVLIIDPDGTTISFYDDLEGPDPVLIHHSSKNWDAPNSFAWVSGSLSGAEAYPLSRQTDFVGIYLLSPEARTQVYVSGIAPPYGPEYALALGFSRESTPPVSA